MAERLLRTGFADGAIFHAYHAYECSMSALIAAHGVPVPASHGARFTLYTALRDSTKPYAATQLRLQRLNVAVRNVALYYDEANDLLPTDQVTAAFAQWALPLVHQFAREVWDEIR